MLIIIADILLGLTLVICIIAENAKIRNKSVETDESPIVKKYGNGFFMVLLLVFAISVLYQLGNVPREVNTDEAGAFYDAMCLSQYGVDRHLNKWPVYLINYGDGQSALYAYLVAVMIKIFGTSVFSLRLPAAILSILAMICLYKLVDENFSRKQALFTVFIYAISPWNIMKSRWGLDCYLMSSMMMIAIYIFIKAINTKKQWVYFLSGLVWGLTLYTYVLSYIVIPVVLAITVIYLLITKKIKIRNIICMGIPLGILAIPLMMMLAYNNGIIEINHYFCFTIPKLWVYRGAEISLGNIKENMGNILDILFVKDFLNYNAIPEFGTLYRLSIPLVVFGILETIKEFFSEIKNKKMTPNLIMLVTFFIMLGLGLCLKEVNINKMNGIYIPMIYFAGKFLSDIANTIKWGLWLVIVFYAISAVMFFHYYFTAFANADLKYFEEDILQASVRAEELQKEKIYVESSVNQPYIYTLIANPISPYEFNENIVIQNFGIVNYQNYYFYIPDDIDKNAVYVIKDNKDKIEELKNQGFEVEQYGEFCVLW